MHARASIAAAAVLSLAIAARAEPPLSFRLGSFSARLYNPVHQQVLQVVGDSINATNSMNRMQVGYRDHFAMPFNGWVVHADNGNSDVGYTNAQSSPMGDVVREPNWFSYCGPTSFSPLRYRDTIWDGKPAPGAMLEQSVIHTPNLNAMMLGNPFGGGRALSARFIAFNSPCQFAGFTVQGVRAAAVNSSVTYDSADTPGNSIFFVECAISADPGVPSVRAVANSATAASEFWQNGIVPIGARFRAEGSPGVQVQFLAHSGWRTLDHLAPEKFSDAALAQLYRATDPPSHVILWIGQNLAAVEATGFSMGDLSAYRENVRAVMHRHNAVIASLGAPPPRWLLVSQYKTGYDESYHLLMAEAQYELAQSDPMVSSLNLYRLAGGEAFNHAAYLTDGVHPSALGVTFLAKLMNTAMQAAAACPGDFDGDGFLTGDDFDSFTALFIAGEASADYNGDGFVNGDDFDQFIEAFIAGC